ncbi:hypothetical protein ACFLQR_00570 [Verrucomicrobiota bacterium]
MAIRRILSLSTVVSVSLFLVGSVLASEPWWNADWRYRVPIKVKLGGMTRYLTPVEVRLDAADLLKQSSVATGGFDTNSVRVVYQGKEIPSEYDGSTVCFIAQPDEKNRERTYWLYVDTVSGGVKDKAAYPVIEATPIEKEPWVSEIAVSYGKFKLLNGWNMYSGITSYVTKDGEDMGTLFTLYREMIGKIQYTPVATFSLLSHGPVKVVYQASYTRCPPDKNKPVFEDKYEYTFYSQGGIRIERKHLLVGGKELPLDGACPRFVARFAYTGAKGNYFFTDESDKPCTCGKKGGWRGNFFVFNTEKEHSLFIWSNKKMSGTAWKGGFDCNTSGSEIWIRYTSLDLDEGFEEAKSLDRWLNMEDKITVGSLQKRGSK